ncbi:MAG TPA: hypothetical protein VI756_25755 [Blastocatellia bacterium]
MSYITTDVNCAECRNLAFLLSYDPAQLAGRHLELPTCFDCTFKATLTLVDLDGRTITKAVSLNKRAAQLIGEDFGRPGANVMLQVERTGQYIAQFPPMALKNLRVRDGDTITLKAA